MFAVPGWSVSADSLKADTAPAKDPAGGSNAAGGKKRKRNNGDGGNVTAANVADLWESVVEGKKKPKSEAKKEQKPQAEGTEKGPKPEAKPVEKQDSEEHTSKKQRKDKKKDKKEKSGEVQVAKSPVEPAKVEKKRSNDAQPTPKKQKKSSKDRSDSNAATPASADKHTDSKKAIAAAAAVPIVPPEPPKLTPLQKSMRDKLISARFRHLNETLYTRPSEEAFQLFADSPEMFDEYHEGFRRQVKVWPENPVDSFLRDVRARAAVKQPYGKTGKSGGGTVAPTPLIKTHLPRTQGTCIIADLGCGDARLAESLQKDSSRLKLNIKSFDLQSPSPLVTKADIANLPLADGSVNVAIFCLALMGTNWLDFVEEAHRILHWKGELWVAEIKSRFAPPSRTKVVNHSVGNRRKNAKAAGVKTDNEDDGADDLAVEVDGVEDKRRETDVAAFVDALRKRGFVPHGEKGEAVDLSNKMFVKMRFLKGAAPTKGKGVQEDDDRAAVHRGRRPMLKWPDGKDDAKKDDVDETKILKACLYKIR